MGLLSFLKGNKENVEEYLPYNLKIGSSLEFDPILFSKLGSDSRFVYKNTINSVKKIGIYDVDDMKYANIYLESVGNLKSYVQIGVKDGVVVECRLFLQYDEIHPQKKEEWKKWVGNHVSHGVIGKDTFVIEDNPLEKIKGILLQTTKNSYPDFRKFGKLSFFLSENTFSTNLLKSISNTTGIAYEEIVEDFEKKLQDEKWFDKIEIKDDEETFILKGDFLECLINTVYKNELGEKKFLDIHEKIYSNNAFFKPDKILKKRYSVYSRQIRGEFYKNEFLELNWFKNDKAPHISIDIGIDIPISQLNKIQLL